MDMLMDECVPLYLDPDLHLAMPQRRKIKDYPLMVVYQEGEGSCLRKSSQTTLRLNCSQQTVRREAAAAADNGGS